MTLECNFVCGGGTPDAATDARIADAKAADATAADAMDAGAGSCGTMTCGTNEVCVRTILQGGVCQQPDDAGMCPPGFMAGSACCVRIPSYACSPRPATCSSTLTTNCACTGLCPSGYTCSVSSNNEVDCSLLAP
jgi:hypothetical protein